jgi:hypothetical protein
MSVSNELSGDVAAALLADRQVSDPAETRELMAIVVQVHSALRDLTAGERQERRRFLRSAEATTQGAGPASRDH